MTEPLDDRSRLRAIHRQGLVPNQDDSRLDRHRRIAAAALDVPVVLLSIVDDHRQFFPSHQGLPESVAEAGETPLSHSFCKHTVLTGSPFLVADAATDVRVADSLAQDELGVGSYLGVPIHDRAGHVLGAFCAIDSATRNWSDGDVELLSDIAGAIESELDHRVSNREAADQLRAQDLAKQFESALGALANATNREDTVKGVAEQLVALAAPAVGATTISLALVEDDELVFTHGPGVPSVVAEQWVRAPLSSPIPMAVACAEMRVVHLEDAASFSAHPVFAEAVADIGIEAFRAIPFAEQDLDLYGVIGVGWPEEMPAAELPHTLDQMVSLAVQCLHRGWRFEAERDQARILERVVLPTTLPASSNYRVAGAYVAPTQAQRIGGDVYDVVVRDDGAIGVLIADAVGHDLTATRAVARIRHAAGVLTLAGESPAAIIRAVNRYVAASPGRRLVTCAYLLFDANGSEVTIANAGHPPPLLRDADGVRCIGPVGSPLLGMGDRSYPEEVVPLTADSVVLAYTDGLIDHRGHDLLQSEAWLADYLKRAESDDPAQLAADLEAEATAWTAEDDIAFVFVTSRDTTNEVVEALSRLYVAGEMKLAGARRDVRTWLGKQTVLWREDDIVLTAVELLTNAREAAESDLEDIQLRLARHGDRIEVAVSAASDGFSHDTAMPDVSSTRGRGLAMVRAMCGMVAIERVGGVVTVRATFEPVDEP